MNDNLNNVLTKVFGLRKGQDLLEISKDNLSQWDSLKQMDLVVSIEREFNILLDISDIVRMNSVKNIISVLLEKGINLET